MMLDKKKIIYLIKQHALCNYNNSQGSKCN
jgi:hypothetical protein